MLLFAKSFSLRTTLFFFVPRLAFFSIVVLIFCYPFVTHVVLLLSKIVTKRVQCSKRVTE
jgi:hypothetical protein